MSYTDSELQEMAIIAIRKYLNKDFTDDEIIENYPLAIKVLAENAKQLMACKMSGVTSVTQGSQSISFKDGIEAFSMTADVKTLLPRPFIKMW